MSPPSCLLAAHMVRSTIRRLPWNGWTITPSTYGARSRRSERRRLMQELPDLVKRDQEIQEGLSMRLKAWWLWLRGWRKPTQAEIEEFSLPSTTSEFDRDMWKRKG